MKANTILTRFLDAGDVATLVRSVGVRQAIAQVAGCLREDFLRVASLEIAHKLNLADPVSAHMGAKLPQIGAAEPVHAATEALEHADALLVVEGGKPLGVITRQDLLGHLSHRAKG